MNREKIIVALDVPTVAQAREIVGELGDSVGAFKIGLQLFTSGGASFVRETVAAGIKLFLDVKFHDIPNTVAAASVEVARLGVWMFNIHTLGGGEMIRRTVAAVREVCERENLVQPKIIGVTILTSADDETLREIGIETETEREVLKLANLASKYCLDGVVASPRETALIRKEIAAKDFLIVTPGIRSRNSGNTSRIETMDDQKRVMTPAEAVRAGADFLVVGRPILRAENRRAAVEKILGEMQEESGK